MKKRKYLLIGFIFFFISVIFISNYKPLLNFFPAQEVNLSNGVSFGAVLKNYLFVQEITLKKRFISRIDIYLAKLPSQNPNENVFLLLDSSHRILFTKRFSSAEIGESVYFPFDFSKTFDIGKGSKIYACIYSIDADQNSYLGLARKTNSRLGKLCVVPIQNNDIVQAIENQQSVVAFEGSIGLKTFETDSKLFSPLQISFYILVVFLTILLLAGRKLKPFFLNTRINPEYAFLGMSLVFGFLMVMVIPPFQVPDEPAHLYRSYQISDFNFFKFKADIPKSLLRLSSICDRMKFNTHEKTSRKEILSLAEIKLDPQDKTSGDPPHYTIPYLPQAFGIFTGKIFHLRPLWLLYLGRVFNLLVSVVLIFLAIKTTPVLNWLFFLLGIMPMTLYQLASLSYDALTISLSFLMIAIILNFALNEKKIIRKRDLLLLFLIAALLASAKPPYFIAAFSFLIIPVNKIGSRKKFSAIFMALATVTIIVSMLWSQSGNIFQKFSNTKIPVSKTALIAFDEDLIDQPAHKRQTPLAMMLPLMPHLPSIQQQSPDQPDTTKNTAQTDQNPQASNNRNGIGEPLKNPYDPQAQQKYILEDPIRYIRIVFNTIKTSIGLYMVSFVGLFGWIDTSLPPLLAYTYLLILLIVSLFTFTQGIQINMLRKSILITLCLMMFVLIETAMYMYCNPVGSNPIIAVQGRYFIAFGPIIFILLYNGIFSKTLSDMVLTSKLKSEKENKNKKGKAVVKSQLNESTFKSFLPWIALAFSAFTLIYSLYVIIDRFYIVII